MEGDPQAMEQVEYYLGVGDYAKTTKEDKPLWNRAIMDQYAPGSTFKLVTALAALENEVITPNSNYITCESPVEIAGWPFKCLEKPNGGHGPLTLRRALATSCNIYFQQLGVKTGIDNIDAMGKLLGLGELTGIDLPGEWPGMRASRETKRLTREDIYDRLWMPADTAQSAIGQFDNAFTILQLARYAAAIATNQLVTPHVIREVVSEDGTVLYTGSTDVIPLGFDEQNLDIIRSGMQDVVTSGEGTAFQYLSKFVEITKIPLACKTGTAETGREDDLKEYSNGLILGFAPANDPQIVIALVVEKGEWGSSTAVIMEDILRAYFGVADPWLDKPESYTPVIGDIIE
jgi:penicillin-binding protein 2